MSAKLATAADLIRVLPSIRWHWRGWLPRGFVTCVVAEPGMGKSQLVMRIAQSLITPSAFPDGSPGPEEAGLVVWADTEAAQSLLADRIQRWRLPAERFVMPGDDPLESISLSSPPAVARLRELVMDVRPAAFVVDSLVGSHGGEENSTRDMGKVMSGLASLARDSNVAVVVVHHLRKRGMNDGQEINLDRVRGSGAITSFARVVLGLESAGEGDALRLSVIKSNLAKRPEPLGVAITDSGLIFGPPPAVAHAETRADIAESFLRERLASGPKPYAELESAGGEAGISKRQLYAARDRLSLATTGGKWALPPAKPHEALSFLRPRQTGGNGNV